MMYTWVLPCSQIIDERPFAQETNRHSLKSISWFGLCMSEIFLSLVVI